METPNNIAPFFIGQKVVSLVDRPLMKKGQVFIVRSVFKDCCVWLVDVGILSPETTVLRCMYHPHNKLHLVKGKPLCPDSTLFAPLREGFEAITFEKVMEQELTSVN